MTEPVTVANLFKRSQLGPGCYIVRNDCDSALPDADKRIVRELIRAGVCAVSHWGLYEPVRRVTALPGGCFFEMVRRYAFMDLPERSWVLGPRPLRHILRLLGIRQPRNRLSGEVSVPPIDELADEWDSYTSLDRLSRIGASLGSLSAVMARELGAPPPSFWNPIELPVKWSIENPPAGISPSDAAAEPLYMFDPRIADAWFWRNEVTAVEDSTGMWLLRPDGELTPYNG